MFSRERWEQIQEAHFFNFDGLLDELRVSNTARSADWIATEYNNQSNPSAFLSVGTQQSAP
jgi:hypothetical protein